MRMSVCKLRNRLFFCKAANSAGELYYAVGLLRRFFGNLTFAEDMWFGVQSDVASAAADCPVLILIVLDLSRLAYAVLTFRTVVIFPFRTFGTDAMRAPHCHCRFFTAIFADFAVRAYFNTIFTFAALITEACTVRAVFAAVGTNVISTVTAVIAVAAHYIGTVNAYATIGTKFVHASGTFSASLADVFRTVGTDDSAPLADLRAVAALIAVLAKDIIRTFTAGIAGHTEFIGAVGAFFITIRAEICTVFAALSAGTYCSAVRAESAGCAEAIRSGTVNTFAAFRTHLSVGAVGALFTTLHANRRTVGTTVSAGADHFYTGDTK